MCAIRHDNCAQMIAVCHRPLALRHVAVAVAVAGDHGAREEVVDRALYHPAVRVEGAVNAVLLWPCCTLWLAVKQVQVGAKVSKMIYLSSGVTLIKRHGVHTSMNSVHVRSLYLKSGISWDKELTR